MALGNAPVRTIVHSGNMGGMVAYRNPTAVSTLVSQRCSDRWKVAHMMEDRKVRLTMCGRRMRTRTSTYTRLAFCGALTLYDGSKRASGRRKGRTLELAVAGRARALLVRLGHGALDRRRKSLLGLLGTALCLLHRRRLLQLLGAGLRLLCRALRLT